MFEFLFKYPASVFSKGDFVLLGSWPKWVLGLLLIATLAGLGYLIWSRLADAAPNLKGWRAAVLWALQAGLAALLLILLWQPAIMIAELQPQQNIIAVLVDDSHSMGITENGFTREAQAVKALQSNAFAELQKKFQTRLYRFDSSPAQVSGADKLQPTASITRIGDTLHQFADETSDLPIGAVVLLSDGSDNTGGVDLNTIADLRSRHIPVHTIGFGEEQTAHDVEMNDANVAPRALAESRLSATVSFHQHGYSGQKGMLTVRDGAKVMAGQQITFGSDGNIQTENLLFNAGPAGAKALQFSIDPLPNEENRNNNSITRLVKVESDKRRILYLEGEPRWEYKFIRRADENDRIVRLISMVRTSENKIYTQTSGDPDAAKELASGFPTTAAELFDYQALIIGSVEVNYFTPAQQALIKDFVDKRGGGLLLLGGRYALSDGGWQASNLADLLPVTLPNRKDTFHRDPATVQLTQPGQESIICRLVEDSSKNADRWKKFPYLADYQDVGTPKPGAAELIELRAGSHTSPFLTIENYGRGRTAVLATSGTWRWQMVQPLGDKTHDDFWTQLLRWLVADTPGRVTATLPNQMLFDDSHVALSAEIRDQEYSPVADAHVEAHILGPDGIAGVVEMTPDPNTPGTFKGDWTAEKPGAYTAEVTADRGDQQLGRDVVNFQRMDGVAENFHTEQNRDLLEKLSSETGGKYWKPDQLSGLANEVPYSEAGITVREAKELWNMPIVFILLLGIPAVEWLLRRKWGIV